MENIMKFLLIRGENVSKMSLENKMSVDRAPWDTNKSLGTIFMALL